MNKENSRSQAAKEGTVSDQGEEIKKDKKLKILLIILAVTLVIFVTAVLAIKFKSPKKALVNVVGDTI